MHPPVWISLHGTGANVAELQTSTSWPMGGHTGVWTAAPDWWMGVGRKQRRDDSDPRRYRHPDHPGHPERIQIISRHPTGKTHANPLLRFASHFPIPKINLPKTPLPQNILWLYHRNLPLQAARAFVRVHHLEISCILSTPSPQKKFGPNAMNGKGFDLGLRFGTTYIHQTPVPFGGRKSRGGSIIRAYMGRGDGGGRTPAPREVEGVMDPPSPTPPLLAIGEKSERGGG